MSGNRRVAAAALTLGLLAGGGAGVVMGVPAFVGAQTSTDVDVAADQTSTDVDVADDSESVKPQHRRGMRGMVVARGRMLQTIAPLIGSTPEEVAAAWRAGTSPAAQAEAAGVPLEQLVEALTAEVEERITTLLQSSDPAPRGGGPRGAFSPRHHR